MSPKPKSAGASEGAPKRMTLTQVVEKLLDRGSSEHSSVTLSRNSKGETQIEVVVRTGDGGAVASADDAEAAAVTIYDRLRERYPSAAELAERV